MWYVFMVLLYSEHVTAAWPCYLCERPSQANECIKKLDDTTECKAGLSRASALDVFEPASIKLSRTPDNAGMHSLLHVAITFEASTPALSNAVADHCALLLVQSVPSSFFVDQFEVRRQGRNIIFNDNIDVEKPQYLSDDATILVYESLKRKHRGLLSSSVSIPWHSRYHRVSAESDDNKTHTHAKVPPPTLWLSCGVTEGSTDPGRIAYCDRRRAEWCAVTKHELIAAPCANVLDGEVVVEKQTCIWLNMHAAGESVTVPIPIGQASDGWFVKSVTIAAAWICTGLVGVFSYWNRL